MSSQRRPPQAAPAGKGAPGGKPGAPGKPGAAERKANPAAGPVITPQVLGIALAIILIVAGVVYYQSVYMKFKNDLATIKGKIANSETNIKTYKQKQAKLADAREVNIALRKKLGTLDYLFLSDQGSLLPFFETELFPIVDASRLQGLIIEVEPYTFEINMAMNPFTTLPSHLIEDANKAFKMKYFGEQNGAAPKGPRDTVPGAFIKPYSIKFKDCVGTYEDIQKFIEDLQQNQHIKLMTIHCVKNSKGDNVRFYRTQSLWNIEATVYFMNPEQAAVGNDPPGLPGSKTCK